MNPTTRQRRSSTDDSPCPSSSVRPGASALISARQLQIGYGRAPIVSHIEFDLQPGSLWGLLGPNGSGKTTFLRTLMGQIKPLGGELHRAPGLRFGYVKQRDQINLVYPFTVREVTMMGRLGTIKCPGRPLNGDHHAVETALSRTGMLERADVPFRDLSGGQKQRVLIARALAGTPDVIILDEPTNDMDLAGEAAVLELIRDIHREQGTAVILVSHLLHTVLALADQIAWFLEGAFHAQSHRDFIEQGHLETIYNVPLHKIQNPDGSYTVVPINQSAGYPND